MELTTETLIKIILGIVVIAAVIIALLQFSGRINDFFGNSSESGKTTPNNQNQPEQTANAPSKVICYSEAVVSAAACGLVASYVFPVVGTVVAATVCGVAVYLTAC